MKFGELFCVRFCVLGIGEFVARKVDMIFSFKEFIFKWDRFIF